jgi:hypothetical protein
MIRDVFYYGAKPNVHPREKIARSLDDARNQCTTEHFWIINEYCDYRGFDWDFEFDFLPDEDVWAEEHNNVWPSTYQTDSGTWLCAKEYSDTIVYRTDVEPLRRKSSMIECWKILHPIEESEFDFNWHPDPNDPPYIYVWGNQWHLGTSMPTVEYHVHGAKQYKYITTSIAILKQQPSKFQINENIEIFDYSWVPDPNSPPYIYVWGNQWNKPEDKISVQYTVEGATTYKFMQNIAIRKPCMDNWIIPEDIDVSNFDFSWEPSPAEPPYVYQFGTQWQKTGGPSYVVSGAATSKFIDTQHAIALPTDKNWEILEEIDTSKFDFSWHPDESSPPYIYVWGNQWNKPEDKISVKYNVKGAAEYKFMSTRTTRLPCTDNWIIPEDIDVSNFDFSWEPSPAEPAYVYEFGTQHQRTGGPKYIMPGSSKTKFIDVQRALALPSSPDNWEILEEIDTSKFDFSWHPDETSPPYIYVWGNQWNKPEDKISVQYKVQGATEYKFMSTRTTRLPCTDNWLMPDDADVSEFDFSWEPSPAEPAYVYEFGTQHQRTGGPQYIVPGAIKKKYIDILKAKALPSSEYWEIPDTLVVSNFDFSWHPDATENPYIYVFGTQWQPIGGPKYVVPGAAETKYIDTKVIHAIVASDRSNWLVPDDVDQTKFDFSWHPHPDDPPFIYQFGTQWQKTNGPRYIITGAYSTKYVDTNILKSTKLPNMENWVVPDGFDITLFDFSWHPDETEPPYIYQFGTVLEEIHLKDGPKYIRPGNRGDIIYMENVLLENAIVLPVAIPRYYIKTTFEDLLVEHNTEVFWALRENIDYTNFDFDWAPTKEQSYNINVFGSAESELTQTYFVDANNYFNGYTDRTYLEDKKIEGMNLSEMFIKPDMFFVDRFNCESHQRYEQLKQRFPLLQKTRFLNTWADTITRCANRSSTEICWILNSELDYTDFDFNYYPNPWQMKMIHIFGTQWSHWGSTFIINRDTFAKDTKYIKVIEHLSNLNFVTDDNKRAKATSCLYDVFVIDFGNKEMFNVLRTLQHKIGNRPIVDVEYAGNYLDTFKEILKQLPNKREHYIWICSSLCNYDTFNFGYICDPFTLDQLHVFPSDKQQYGDTFLVNVNKLRELIDGMQTLEDYGWLNNKINFNQAQRVNRYYPPVIITEDDTHVANITTEFDFPYAIFVTNDNKNIVITDDEPINLWSQETKNLLITSTGGSRIIVPKEAKQYIETQLYDYPYIKNAPRLAKSNPLDIIYLSNGEKCAEENYEHLLRITKGLPNRIVRVDGINGRVQAYHAAANASNTSWFLTVFAKLKVNAKFDFNWQPDRLQIPKHYMFLAKNPVNNLVYGHQGMIAYNKQLTLDNEGYGLDFTLDSPHETVDILSGIATYNMDEFSTWRTAFREAIKLKQENSAISLSRLETWATKAEGDFSEYSIQGTLYGIEYFDENNGDMQKLKLSYEWDWLKSKFNSHYKNT